MKSKKKLLNLFVFLHCQSLCLKAKKKSIRQNICSNSPVLNRRLLFWEDSSHPPVSSWDLPLWDGPGLNARHLWIFQVNHIFCKLVWKLWLVVTKLGAFVALATIFIMNSRSMPTKGLIVLALAKEAPGTSLRINTVCNF